MAKYFHISTGLRGCYMPDSSYVFMAGTRRELKQAIAYEADNQDSDGSMVGFSKKAIASFAAQCWREAHKKPHAYLPYCLPFAHKPEGIGQKPDYHYGIFCSVASRGDYLTYQKEENP